MNREIQKALRDVAVIEERVVSLKAFVLKFAELESQPMKNPAFFDGVRLSEAGIAHIYRLYDEGHTVKKVMVLMCITYKGAKDRYDMWKVAKAAKATKSNH